MVLSGIALVIFDSRIIQRYVRRILNKFRRSNPEPELELGTESQAAEESTTSVLPEAQPEIHPVDRETPAASASGVNTQQTVHVNAQADLQTDNATRSASTQDVKVPYSIFVGLSILVFFIVSFVVIMVIRGVLDDLPTLFRFFANIFLAGIFHVHFDSC